MRCVECSNELKEGAIICPVCKARQIGVVAPAERIKAEAPRECRQQQKAVSPVQAQTQKVTQVSKGISDNATVSVGEWFLTFLVSAIPCLNIVMMVVWAFGKDTKPSKANYCKVVLIMAVIMIVLMIVMIVAMGGMVTSILNNF